MLLTNSCSGLVQPRTFLEVVRDAALDLKSEVRILARTGAAPDHPVNPVFPEGRYLKSVFLTAGGAGTGSTLVFTRRVIGELKSSLAEARRLAQRTACERVNSRLKDQFGGNTLRVRGPTKAMCHLMFGILALTVDQLTRLVS